MAVSSAPAQLRSPPNCLPIERVSCRRRCLDCGVRHVLMLSAAAAAGAAASFIGTPPLRSPSCRPLPVRCSVTALEGDQVWSALALANDALPGADVVDLDLLDALILTPLLVPILGLAIIRSGAAAAGAS